MTCGIYKITFPSGEFYIGKSINIEKRWEQHADKFRLGKHTKNMQRAFDVYGAYNTSILLEVHEDHLDIIEETYIARLAPSLNGNSGRDRLDIVEDKHLDIFLSYFNMSTLEHIAVLHNSKNLVEKLKEELDELNSKIDILEEKVIEIRDEEEIQRDITGRINNLEQKNQELSAELEEKDQNTRKLLVENFELQKYRNLPWYRKLFN